jgi:hypothetical protein
MASSSSSDNSTGSGHSVFDHPRRAPRPPQPSSRSARSTPEGFVLPPLPPSNDPLVVTYDDRGHRRLPHVSDTPLGVEDGRVMKLVEHNSMVRVSSSSLLSFTNISFSCPPRSFLSALTALNSVPFARSPRPACLVLPAPSSGSPIAIGQTHLGLLRTSAPAATHISPTNATSW